VVTAAAAAERVSTEREDGEKGSSADRAQHGDLRGGETRTSEYKVRASCRRTETPANPASLLAKATASRRAWRGDRPISGDGVSGFR
jgi:hypothetical protein